jgi:hypothetical protein
MQNIKIPQNNLQEQLEWLKSNQWNDEVGVASGLKRYLHGKRILPGDASFKFNSSPIVNVSPKFEPNKQNESFGNSPPR